MTDLKTTLPTFYSVYRYFLGKYKKLTRKTPAYKITGQLPSADDLEVQRRAEAWLKRPYKVVVRIDDHGTPVTAETRWERSADAWEEVDRNLDTNGTYTVCSAEVWHNGEPCMELIQDPGQSSGYRWVSTG
jgi:hypothetical protein